MDQHNDQKAEQKSTENNYSSKPSDISYHWNKIGSHKGRALICAFVCLVVAILIFGAGVLVGFEKARFSQRLGERYYRDFIGGPRGGARPFMDRDYLNAHGAKGVITAMNGNNITIKDNGITKDVVVSDSTMITKNNQPAKISDLKVNDQVTVIGAPNDQGDVQAKFINVISGQ